MELEEIKDKILEEFGHIMPVELSILEGEIVFEEDYFMEEDEKTDQYCYEMAKENGEMIVSKFPMLEISNYYCHRSKYSIVCLKLKTN
jgi:hypothetical protein